jgi:osmotically-inducible protein OsmY
MTQGRLGSRGLGGVTVREEAGVVVLEGTVASTSDRLLAEKMIAIEPGVRRVENRLSVAGEAELLPPLSR